MSDAPAVARAPAIGFVLATLAIDALGVGMVIPVIPGLVRALSGLHPSAASRYVGMLVACYAVAQFVAAPILGALSDRFGRRPVILISVAGIAANYVLLALAPSLPWLFLGRVLAGATGANVSATNAYIADVSAPEQRARRFGLVGAVFGCTFVFGPAIGGALGAVHLRLPFAVAAGLAGINLLYGLFVLPESLPRERRRAFAWRRANPVGSLGALTATEGGGRLALAWACMWFALGTMQTVFVLYTGLRLGWGPRENGAALALVGLTQAVVQGLLVRQATRRLGERRTALVALTLSVGAYVLFGLADRGWMIYAAIVLQAAGAMASPSVRALISRAAPADRQGETQGALASVEGLTAVCAPLVASFLFARFADPAALPNIPGAAFFAAAAMYAIAVVSVSGTRQR
jgi:DHA1 family tetracycline resistance protein-like MFS transporter